MPPHRSLFVVLGSFIAVLLTAGAAQAVVEQPFAVRYSANDHGAITVTGNTLETCPAAVATCAAAQAGTATGAALNNNGYAMTRVDVDADPTTFDSSTATLAPPAGATVLFAGLYWGGRTSAASGGAAAPSPAARGSVLLQAPGGSYQPITGAVADSAAVTSAYTGFADVTALVAAGGPGAYTVANVQSGTGIDRYAGWSLVVAYRSAAEPLRNLTVFDGLATIQQGDQPLSLTVNGFTTPRTGAVRTSVGLVAYEGDRGSAGDKLLLNGQPLSDAANPANNVFNSSISADGIDTIGTRTPGYVNQLGFDADRISTQGLIANGATSATLQLSTTLDQYLTQMVSLATDLSAPVLTATKRVENVTRGGDGGSAQPGDVLRYTVDVTNTGDDEAEGVTVADAAPAGTTAVGAFGGTIGSLAPGASASVTFDVRVGDAARDGDVIVNAASVTGRGATAGLPVTATTGEVRTTVHVPALPPLPVPPAFEITTGITPETPVAGEPATTTVDLVNRTPAPVDDVVVTVTVPGATVLTATITGGTCTVAGGSVATCRIATVAPGQHIVVKVRARPKQPGKAFAPVVTVTGRGIATQRVVVGGAGRVARPAALRVTKRAAVGRARPGQAVAYRIVVRSSGGVAARGIRVCDLPGARVRLTSVPGARRVRNGGACWTVRGTLAPGRTRTFRAVATVDPRGTRPVTVTNTARATAANVAGRAAVSRARVRVTPLSAGPCRVVAAAAAAIAGPRAHAAC